MKVTGERILEGVPHLETTEDIDIYGTPTESLLETSTQSRAQVFV